MRNRIFIGIIILSCVVALYAGYGRYTVESGYKNVEITGDLDALKAMADYAGMDTEELISKYKAEGMNSIAVNEVRLKVLQSEGKLSYMTRTDAAALGITSGNLALKRILASAEGFLPDSTVILTGDRSVYEFLAKNLTKRYDGVVYSTDGEYYAIAVNKPIKNLETDGLGFDTRDFELVKASGLIPVARIENYEGLRDRDIDEYINMLKSYGIDQVVFGGDEVLGNEEKIDYAGKRFKEEGIAFGIIELPVDKDYETQEGMSRFAKRAGYNAFKLFSLSEKEMAAYDKIEMADKWYRAVIDRNVRMIYVRPEIRADKPGVYNVNFYGDTIAVFKGYMDDIGEKIGKIVPFKEYHVPRILQVVIGLGVVAGSVMLLDTLIPLSDMMAHLLMVLGTLITIGTLYSRFFDLGVKALALASSVVFPSLAMAYIMRVCEKKQGSFISYTVVNFVKASLISAVGALYIASIMADSKYLLKLDFFRGVKVSFVAPVVYFLVLYFVRYFRKDLNLRDKIAYILNLNVKVWYVVIAVVAAVVAFIYISRTGNNPAVGVSDLELQFRSLLEHTLVARPREKEFLVGYPALILMLGFVYQGFKKEWSFVWGIFASIGQLSLVNTFSHLRAPLGISIERTIYGMVLGIIIGFVYFVVARYILGYLKRKWGVGV
ncbi:DUF5693 family protein [Calorimonas adulescens]|uniref:Uncharacterized protein n=1 Tax=Calorimonas adulescens TaxID=2606906 RepID=A0A5D8QCM8_9THEO|nr:DUF5693 family protein [Calorimonas adulescens]TZE81088.1 hypothetical protein FWJ32_10740 [Calorimonas adulescens]